MLFGERQGPDGTQLGRRPDSGRKAADVYKLLLAAEPHATAERKRELRTEAVKKARQSPLFFDLTISLSKSISIFHASLGENARLARQAGDHDGDPYWSALVGEVDDMIWQAVHAGFGYFQREAGYTRTGSHGTRVHGRETGQWHEADLAVAHWLQHTSRDGDMQLHVHSQIAHVARTSTDGKWRAPDSLGYNEHIGAVAAIVSQHLEEALTARFGLEWVARDDGHGFEIKGISGEMMRVFSSRRASITADLRGRAARFEQRYGRAPSQRELAQLAQASNFTTRNPEARRAGSRAGARGLGGQARAHARRLAGVGRAVGLAWRRATQARTRTTRIRRLRFPRNSSWPARRRRRSRWRSRKRARGPARTWSSTWAASCPAPAGIRPRPPRCCRTWPTGRWPRSSNRSPAWKHPSPSRYRPACCARMGAASTSGMAVPGMPRARSWRWKNAWSRKPARAARRA